MVFGRENCYHCVCFPGCFREGRAMDVTGHLDTEPVFLPDGNTDEAVCERKRKEKENELRDRGRK